MKLKVIQGEKGKKQETQQNQNQSKQTKDTSEKKPAQKPVIGDYYARGPIHAQSMEKAEGDEDIVDEALRRQSKTGDAA